MKGKITEIQKSLQVSPESCLVKSHIEKMTRTVTVGHTSHIYKIGHRRILNRDTCRTGAADAWVFAGRQCEKILHPFFFFFFIYSCLCQALHVHETHTERYFTGLGCYFSYHGASFVLTLLPFLYFVAVIPFLY